MLINELNEAQMILNRALTIFPSNPKIKLLAVQLALQKDEKQKAKKYLQQLISHAPDLKEFESIESIEAIKLYSRKR